MEKLVKRGWMMPDARAARVRFRLGEFDPFDERRSYSKKISSDAQSTAPEHRALALKVAQESIVLLKNKENFLPLDTNKIKTIAVIGPLANVLQLNNYNGKAPESASGIARGIKDYVGPNTKVLYGVGGVHWAY